MESHQQAKLTIINFTGKKYYIDYLPIMTVGELKLAINSFENSMPEFELLYAGKMIRTNDKLLESFISEENLTIYMNAKGVHGGCCQPSM